RRSCSRASFQAARPWSRGGRPPLSALGSGVGEEQLLTTDLVARDGGLAIRANKPVDEGLSFFCLHIRMFLGIDQDHTVLVEELGIALNKDFEIIFVCEAQPRSPIGERVGLLAYRRVEGRAHARTGFKVPATA